MPGDATAAGELTAADAQTDDAATDAAADAATDAEDALKDTTDSAVNTLDDANSADGLALDIAGLADSADAELPLGQDTGGLADGDAAGSSDGSDGSEIDAAPAWLGVCPPDEKPIYGNPMVAIGYPVPGVGCAKKGWPTPPNGMPPLWTDLTTAVGLGNLGHVDPCIVWQDLSGDGHPELIVSEEPLSPTAKRTLRTFEWVETGPWPGTKLTLPASLTISDCNPVDYDNDGDADIAMATSGGLRMILNGFGKLLDAPVSAVPEGAKGTQTWSTATVDFDRDGDHDLYLARNGEMGLKPGQFECNPFDGTYMQCCYGPSSLDTTCAPTMASSPTEMYQCCTQFPPGAEDLLLRSVSQGIGSPAMALVPLAPGCTAPGATLVAAIHDINRDGWSDVFTGDDFGPLGFYRFASDGTCTYHGKATGLLGYGHTMGVALGDFDHDGLDDLFQGDAGSATFYRGLQSGGFIPAGSSWGISNALKNNMVWAQLAADFDNDGWVDVWSQTSFSAQDGKLKQALQAKDALPLLAPGFHAFFQNHATKFTPTLHPWPSSKDQHISALAMAAADMEGDGDLDIVYNSPGGQLRLLRNDAQPGNHWIYIDLVRDISALGGIGAKVQVWAQGYVQEREITWSPGAGAHGTFTGHIGLGGVTKLDQVVVWWPSGRVSLLGPQEVDKVLVVAEATAKVKPGSP